MTFMTPAAITAAPTGVLDYELTSTWTTSDMLNVKEFIPGKPFSSSSSSTILTSAASNPMQISSTAPMTLPAQSAHITSLQEAGLVATSSQNKPWEYPVLSTAGFRISAITKTLEEAGLVEKPISSINSTAGAAGTDMNQDVPGTPPATTLLMSLVDKIWPVPTTPENSLKNALAKKLLQQTDGSLGPHTMPLASIGSYLKHQVPHDYAASGTKLYVVFSSDPCFEVVSFHQDGHLKVTLKLHELPSRAAASSGALPHLSDISSATGHNAAVVAAPQIQLTGQKQMEPLTADVQIKGLPLLGGRVMPVSPHRMQPRGNIQPEVLDAINVRYALDGDIESRLKHVLAVHLASHPNSHHGPYTMTLASLGQAMRMPHNAALLRNGPKIKLNKLLSADDWFCVSTVLGSGEVMVRLEVHKVFGGEEPGGGPPAAAAASGGAAASAAPAAAGNSQDPHYRLFTCQRARKLKGTVEWRYRDDGGTQGPFSPDEMSKLFTQKRIHPDTVIVGSNPDVKYPNLPGTKFYKPLSELLNMVAGGGHYEPCTKEDVKKGRPEAGWNEGGGGVAAGPAAGTAGAAAEVPAAAAHHASGQAAGLNWQSGNKGGSTDRSHHQSSDANGHGAHERHHGPGKGPRHFNQPHGRHGPGGRHGRNHHHFAPQSRDHTRNPADVPPHMQPGAVVTRWPAKGKGPEGDGSNHLGTPSKSSEDGSSTKGGPASLGTLNTSHASSNPLMNNHIANLPIGNGHLGGGPLKPGARELLHGLGNMHGNHMGGMTGAGMLHSDVLHNFAPGRGILQPSALLGGGMSPHGFNPIVGAGHLGAQGGLLQPNSAAAHQFAGNLGMQFGGAGAMHHPLLQPRLRPELQQVLTGNSDNPKEHPSWWFLDSYGTVQGPHSPDEMLGWFIEGLIHPSTMVCSTVQEVVRPFSPGAHVFWPLSHLLELAAKGMLRKPLGFADLQQAPLGPAGSQPQQQQQAMPQQLGALLGGAAGASPLMHHALMQHGLGGQMRIDPQGLLGRSLLLNSINAARPHSPGQPHQAAATSLAAAAAAVAGGQRPMFNLAAQGQHLGLHSPATTPSAAQMALQAQLPQMSLPAQAAAQLANFGSQLPGGLGSQINLPQSASQLAGLGSHLPSPLGASGPQINLTQSGSAAQLANLGSHLQHNLGGNGSQINLTQSGSAAQLANLGSHLQNNLGGNGPQLNLPQSAAQLTVQTSMAQGPMPSVSLPASLPPTQAAAAQPDATTRQHDLASPAPASGPIQAAALDFSKLSVSTAV